jgi:glutathione peroxidase
MAKTDAYSFSFQGCDNTAIKLADFKGKVIMVVNTASFCGFTPQYRALQELHEQYYEQGLRVIAVPSRDFRKQEFSQIEKVVEFARDKFAITFPITKISTVKGNNAHAFYLWANQQAGWLGSPKWNFHKYVIDKQGDFVTWFSSLTKPNSPKVINLIEQQLAN